MIVLQIIQALLDKHRGQGSYEKSILRMRLGNKVIRYFDLKEKEHLSESSNHHNLCSRKAFRLEDVEKHYCNEQEDGQSTF